MGEALTLPFAGRGTDYRGEVHAIGVDWDRHRLKILGTHKGSKSRRYREMPIRPKLYEILIEAYGAGMGHTPRTSQKHYVSPTDAEFESVTGGSGHKVDIETPNEDRGPRRIGGFDPVRAD